MNGRIKINDAKYAGNYVIQFVFSDGQEQFVNFENYLTTRSHPQNKKYLNVDNFKKFRIDNADVIVWGKNWDLCFDINNLYHNDLFIFFDNYERGKDKIISMPNS